MHPRARSRLLRRHRKRAGYHHAYCEHHCRIGPCLQPALGSRTTSSARRCDRRLGGILRLLTAAAFAQQTTRRLLRSSKRAT
jgi:hypothetical protein